MVEHVPQRHLSGGIRLDGHKTASTAAAIRRGFVPGTLMLSLLQHRGAPAELAVAVGDDVRKGSLIGKPAAANAVAVHASSSGRVTAITERLVPIGAGIETATCIVIATDGRDEAVSPALRAPWPSERGAQLQCASEGGLAGLGGAVFPTAAKLAATAACRALIVNGAECEPYISCDDMLMREAAPAIVAGALRLADLAAAPLCIIAIERDKPRAIEAIRDAAQDANDPRLKLAEVPTIYPAGGERQLIELLTGDEVPAGVYPSAIGYLCQNVATAFALQRLAAEREPLTTRIVTVTGGGVRQPQNIEVPIGTLIAELIDACGGYTEHVARLICGGSMMGIALPSDELPVTKGVNCIVAATAGEIRADRPEWPCIRCGDCAAACPARLAPQELLIAAKAADYASLTRFGLSDCIECGCCDVVCPSQIVLTERFRVAKRAIALAQSRRQASAKSA